MIDHCISVFSKQQEETLYRVYVTDSLRLIAKNTARLVQEGEYMNIRYFDLLKKRTEKEDERTGEEIADEVIKLICM